MTRPAFPIRSVRASALGAALIGAALMLLPATGALAAEPVPLGTFTDWRAYKVTNGPNTICYALSQPKDTAPKNVKRGQIYVMVANWPGRNVKGEVSVVAGYPYKKGSNVTADVDGAKHTLFTENDAQNEGGAWVQDRASERKLISAMKRGNSLRVQGTSGRGTLTTDRYSLSGVTAAIKAIDDGCK
ncbi:Mlr4354 like protein [Candidatus Phaeomarinobacter ectocarpi]|uniref:Mlr4354 like protein n=1 Tax=Candidatus Phaeomarinibacter ectocarpi TaxID=1458461 RepID=X5MF15_9HYPH|nr:invasion associated locus B family protein [Candidatus Phaeomarinobacter ectocarpi]CDO59574.1 Mlr4354 like protein [Candidatus Phaeomarinobacter ectocarpi]